MFDAAKSFVSSWNTKIPYFSSHKTDSEDVKSEVVDNSDEAQNNQQFPDFTSTIASAKEWSAYLYKKAVLSSETTAKSILEKAKSVDIKTTFEKIPLWSDFEHFQKEFSTQINEDLTNCDGDQSILPWDPEVSGLTDPTAIDALKNRILLLSQQQNTFLLPPPSEAHIDDDVTDSVADLQLAKSLLAADENLAAMRYKLVPGRISENTFWRNYFYRLSLVKRSAQLSAMTGCSSDDSGSADFVCVDKNSIRDSTDSTPPMATKKKPVENYDDGDNKTKRKTKKNKNGNATEASTTISPPVESSSIPSSETKPAAQSNSANDTDDVDDELEKELAREIDELDLQNEDVDFDEELEMELLTH